MPGLCATYYVSSEHGSDSNTGRSDGAAWRTLARVNRERFLPGDIIRLESGGLWRETLKLSSSGTLRQPIVVTGYGSGALPVIAGGEVNIDNNQQSHLKYMNLDLRDAYQGLRLYSWKTEVTDVSLSNSVITTVAAERGRRISAGVYANSNGDALSHIMVRNNHFVPYSAGLENWGIYFAGGLTDFVIEENVLSPAGEDAITVWHCSRGVIRGNRGGGNGENTIDVKDSREILIAKNVAINDSEYNIVVHAVDRRSETRQVTLSGNHCIGGGLGAQLTAGIALLGIRDSHVIGNHIDRAAGEAILVHDADRAAGNEIRGNFLRRNGVRRASRAIVIQGTSGTVIADNYIQP